MRLYSAPLNQKEQQKIDLTDLCERVEQEAYKWGPEDAFDAPPHRFHEKLESLLNSNDPFEMINFLGYDDFSEYIREEAV